MGKLSITFCGFELENPLMLSSSPVTNTGEMIARAFDAGFGGAVYKTLGLEQSVPIVNVTPRLAMMSYEDKRMVGLQNIELITDRPLLDNLRDITELKKKYPRKYLVVSIMGEVKKEAWQELARRSQDAGADALELNFSCPHGMPEKGMGAAIGQNPEISAMITGWVKEAVTIPVMVKLTPNITDMRVVGRAVKAAGADALAAINTIQCISGVDLDTLVPRPSVGGYSAFGGYSGAAVKPIALRFVAQLGLDPEIGLPISGMGGVMSWSDCLEFMLLGASTVQMTTVCMRYGYRVVEDMLEGMRDWLDEKGYDRIGQIVGKSLAFLRPHEQLSRDYRVKSSIDHGLCEKCDECYVSCRDGGHSAITLNAERLPIVDEAKCAGCGLCALVCPVPECITLKPVGTATTGRPVATCAGTPPQPEA